MSEIKVGEYVRTREGYIAKIIERIDYEDDLPEYILDTEVYFDGGYSTYIYDEDIVAKYSFNIIDLIEVGDYINGEKVKAIGYPFKDSVKEVIFEDDGHTPKIATIVTKEQFERMEYKVNDK